MDKICKHVGELCIAAIDVDAGVQIITAGRILNGILTGSRPAAAGHHHRRCREISGDNCRDLVESPKITSHRRQRRRHDRLVQRTDERHQHQAGQDLATAEKTESASRDDR